MKKQISVIYSHQKKRLTILQGGKPVGGFCGDIATTMAKKIMFHNAMVEVKDGNVQVGL